MIMIMIMVIIMIIMATFMIPMIDDDGDIL